MSWKNAIKKSIKPQAEFCRPKFSVEDIDWSRVVTVDFETYYDTHYTLKKLSTSEYVRHDLFKIQMVGIKIGNKPTKVYDAKKGAAALKRINWSTHTLLCHNAAFDGFILSHHLGIVPSRYYDTLSMARGLHSNEVGGGLDDVAKFYGGEGKIDGLLEQSKGIWDWPSEMFGLIEPYCAQDVDETFRIFQAMAAKMPADEMDLIDLTIRMFCDPVLRIDIPRVEAEYAREVEKRERLFYEAVPPWDYDIGGQHHDPEFFKKSVLKTKAERALEGDERQMLICKRLLGNNEFYADLLRAEGIEPPTKVSKAWMKKEDKSDDDDDKHGYAFAKDDLAFTGLPDAIDQWRGDLNPNSKDDIPLISAKQDRIRNLVEARLAVKSTTNITRAERFLEAGKDGMPLPVGYSYYRAHCLTGDAQVLTRDGWVALADWTGGEIAQWSEDGSIRFAPATANRFEVHENLVQASSRYHSCTYTKGHTLPTLTSYGTFKPRKAGEALSARFDIPITGVLDGATNITPLQAQLAVMVQADGNVRDDVSRGQCVRFGFSKSRKIERCKQLLNAANIEFTEAWEGDVCRIRVGAAHYNQLIELVGVNKQFSHLLFDAPVATKEAFVSELAHWDGDVEPQPKGFTYSTTNGHNAQFVATMAHLSGRAAFISTREREENWSAAYRVYIRKDAKTRSEPKHYEEVLFKGTVYCPTTETGYFMVRQRGNIAVTGNTGRWGGNNKMNMQNLTRGGELRLSILAPDGHEMCVADSGQIEARVNGWLWEQDDLLDAFRKADTWDKSKGVARGDNRDAYCRFADDVYGREITTEDKMERFVGKVCVLGLGFQMGAPKFQMTLAKGALGGPPVFFELDECYRIVNTYRSRNHKIRDGWAKCTEIIEAMAQGRTGAWKCIAWEKETIWLPNGMSLKYPDLKASVNKETGYVEYSYQAGDMRSKIYGGLLCENIVQALARIIVATQMLAISRRYRVVMTTHDEVVAMPKTREASRCFDYMMQCMTTPPVWCPDIPLAAEGGWAKNYSK